MALSMVCLCAATRRGPSFVFPSPPLSAFTSIHGLSLWMGCVYVSVRFKGGGGVILAYLIFLLVKRRVYRISLGEDRKVRHECLWSYFCIRIGRWADSVLGGAGRCLTLHLFSVTLINLQLQDTALSLSSKKENLKIDLLGLLLNSTRKLILLSHTWIDSFTFSSTPVDTEI